MATAAAAPITVKLGHLFKATDTDGDGCVRWSDYQRLIDRCLSAHRIDGSGRRAQALAAAYQMYWMELLRHADSDARLNR